LRICQPNALWDWQSIRKRPRTGSALWLDPDLIDSVYREANVNTDKDDPDDPEDPDARWGIKLSYKVKIPEGKEKLRTNYFYLSFSLLPKIAFSTRRIE